MGKQTLVEGLSKILVMNTETIATTSYLSKREKMTLSLYQKPINNIYYVS